MASDKVGIANLSFSRIGMARISSFSEGSPRAQAVAEVYPDVLDMVLAEGPWSFAQKGVALAQLAVTPGFTADGLSVVYAEPADLISINLVSQQGCAYVRESINNQNVIRTNIIGLQIMYTYRNTNPITYHPAFVEALATRLAYELCFKFTESRGYAKDLHTDYHTIKLPKALSQDSQQSSPRQAIQNEWFQARISGYGGPIVQPGQATWHPQW